MAKKQKTKGKAKKAQQRTKLKPTVVDIPQQALLPQLPSESESAAKTEIRFNKKTVLLFIIIISVIILMLVLYIVAQQGAREDSAGQVIGALTLVDSCADTDETAGSTDAPSVAGKVTIKSADTNEQYPDTCTGNYLTEYYCNGKNIESKVYKCATTCVSGACAK
ncbi:hypothetical protein HZA96_07305 [Candidatus Woesearchaeota archaeon]|nr:hypothetical protein [Candidatus Woesearchaeota archaeon]